ncbi:sugar transferase [Bythopirellula polymerisocia]|uniref:Undecaprenyl phosphate N,N'-diacetylbacillosamine 1-phosphate transferase n=1 Tax=Bythopirellula polymerisocia TaxID=2528003 RepID=A0A5C6C9N2_9BACT|nr:sugar transferase [Bythopirellula polymerisocia]TWU20862.1 Undecaprenyl phosphate N,N'-diacetylbacillosamine 1-phosphate transferase [Bythopirellula polymerisocia]
MKSGLLNVRKLHAHIFRNPEAKSASLLLSERDLRFAAECERMRVDRNGSVLSILFIKLAENHNLPQDMALLERILEGRLRVTDTPGILEDGRVVVLLPDTSSDGAWKVAADISEVYPLGPTRPECEVIIYPDKGHRREKLIDGEEVAPNGERDKSTVCPPLFATPIPRWKRSLDILGGLVGLIASAPLITVAAIAIRCTSRGSIFYGQEREGWAGKRFKMYKLRTMVNGADEMKEYLRHLSHQDGPAFKMKSDPRTTPVGRLLRWTSIDELPQLWNVLKGDMSLVGPRPLPTSESQSCTDWQRRRLSVLPGMTCTWQVFARGDVSFDEWIRMDLQYSRQVSLWGDIKLLMLTLPSLVLRKGMR